MNLWRSFKTMWNGRNSVENGRNDEQNHHLPWKGRQYCLAVHRSWHEATFDESRRSPPLCPFGLQWEASLKWPSQLSSLWPLLLAETPWFWSLLVPTEWVLTKHLPEQPFWTPRDIVGVLFSQPLLFEGCNCRSRMSVPSSNGQKWLVGDRDWVPTSAKPLIHQ